MMKPKNTYFITIAIVIFIICIFALSNYINQDIIKTTHSITQRTIASADKTTFDDIIQKHQKASKSKHALATIMNSETGEILYSHNADLASSYQFEPSSIMLPITVAIALDLKKITLASQFSAYNYGNKNAKGEYPYGIYQIGNLKIKDNMQLNKNILSVADVIEYSSDIGALQIAHKINAKDYTDGLYNFGFAQKTNRNNPNENSGWLPSVATMSIGEQYAQDNIYKATVSYGQGMTATQLQLIKAYSIFNNDGAVVSPTNKIDSNATLNKKVISMETAGKIKTFLVSLATKKLPSLQSIEGAEIGAVSSTSLQAENDSYSDKPINNIVGFVNFNKKKYVIGVTAIESKPKAFNTAKNIFSELAQALVIVDKNIIDIHIVSTMQK